MKKNRAFASPRNQRMLAEMKFIRDNLALKKEFLFKQAEIEDKMTIGKSKHASAVGRAG